VKATYTSTSSDCHNVAGPLTLLALWRHFQHWALLSLTLSWHWVDTWHARKHRWVRKAVGSCTLLFIFATEKKWILQLARWSGGKMRRWFLL